MTEPVLHGVLYGHGHMGRLHATKLAARADVKLDIIDPNLGLMPPKVEVPDFAIIATPTRAHAEVAMPLLERGIPCLIEKPLASVMTQAQALARHPHLSVGHIERFNPVFSAIEDITPEYIEAERLSPSTGRSQDIDVIGDLMIHDLDLVLRHMPGKVTDVRAKGVGLTGSMPDMVNARIEIALPGGAVGVANLTASRVSSVSLRVWRVFSPGQYWSLDLQSQTGKTIEWPAPAKPVSIEKRDPLTSEHSAFLGAVRGRNPYPCTGLEALNALHLAQRIRQCLH